MNDSMPNKKIIDLLQKLMAHQKSAEQIGSVEEAGAFAQKIASLLAAHNLTMSEVETISYMDQNPIGKTGVTPKEAGYAKSGSRVSWQSRLACVIANNHFCYVLVSSGTNTFSFVGRESDRQVACYIYCYLARVAVNLSRHAWKKFCTGRRKQTDKRKNRFQRNYLEGFVIGVQRRYLDIAPEPGEIKSENALLYIDRTDRDINEYLSDATTPKAFKKSPKKDDEARRIGYLDGRDCDLPNGLQEPSNSRLAGLLGE